MGERYLAGGDVGAAADHGYMRGGMVRRPERSCGNDLVALAGQRIELGCLENLLVI